MYKVGDKIVANYDFPIAGGGGYIIKKNTPGIIMDITNFSYLILWGGREFWHEPIPLDSQKISKVGECEAGTLMECIYKVGDRVIANCDFPILGIERIITKGTCGIVKKISGEDRGGVVRIQWEGEKYIWAESFPPELGREKYISKIEEKVLVASRNWESIQDYLIDIGFEVNTSGECFYKWTTGWTKVEILFKELAGKSIAYFQKKAKEEKWI